jgi:hypothetical protein
MEVVGEEQLEWWLACPRGRCESRCMGSLDVMLAIISNASRDVRSSPVIVRVSEAVAV